MRELSQTFCWFTSQAPFACVPESSVLNPLDRPTAATQSHSGLIRVMPHLVENVIFALFLTRGLNPTNPIRCDQKYVEGICWFAAGTVRPERVHPQEAPHHLVTQLCLSGRTWPPSPPPSSPTPLHGHSTCCEIVPTVLLGGFVLRKNHVDEDPMNHSQPACPPASLPSTVGLFSLGL